MPNSPMTRFEPFIGTWNTTGEVLETSAGPAGTMVATDTYRWGPGRHFIVHEVDARFDGAPSRSMELFGHDASKRRYVSTSYDDQGATDHFVMTLERQRYTISGMTVRFHGSFDTRKTRLEGLWELKGPKGRWQPWIRLQLLRA